jgi:hypothetical protein
VNNAAEKLLAQILAELDELGVGTDEAVAGADAVDYLGRLRTTLASFLACQSAGAPTAHERQSAGAPTAHELTP